MERETGYDPYPHAATVALARVGPHFTEDDLKALAGRFGVPFPLLDCTGPEPRVVGEVVAAYYEGGVLYGVARRDRA
jgi:hypothetical protein